MYARKSCIVSARLVDWVLASRQSYFQTGDIPEGWWYILTSPESPLFSVVVSVYLLSFVVIR